MADFAVRVELADVITVDEVRAELAADPGHRLLQLDPRLRTNAQGRAEVEMRVSGPDVWTVVLAVMGLFGQSSVGLASLHVDPVRREARRTAA